MSSTTPRACHHPPDNSANHVKSARESQAFDSTPLRANRLQDLSDIVETLSPVPSPEELERRRRVTETALQEQLTTAAEQVVAAEAKVRAGAAAISAAAAAAKAARQENKDAEAINDLQRAADAAARVTVKVANDVQAAKTKIEVAANVSLSPDLETVSQELRRIKNLHE